jgi:hypothetical protein
MAAMLHPFARTDITGMHRMPARRTVTTAQAGLRAESLSELDRGSTGFMADIGDTAVTMDAAAMPDADLQGADLKDAVDLLHGVERLAAARLAADSMAVAPGHSTVVAAASMVEAAVSTAVAEAMAAVGTGN